MDLKYMNDECLLSETLKLVRRERELLTVILHHLREIERRRLYCHHPSLFAYATEVLGYSADQAYRRIAAMRLMNEMPGIEEKIESGQINLTHVGIAQGLFKQEKKAGHPLTLGQKLEVFDAIAGQSTRQAERVALTFSTEAPRFKETVKPSSPGLNILTIEISDEALARLQALKGLLAHKHPDLTHGELVELISVIALEQLNPAKPPQRKVSLMTRAAVKRAVWARDRGTCTRCGSNHKIEFDHVVPASMGGPFTVENIRLLCESCNQRAAIEKLGQEKMDPYLSPAAPRKTSGS